MNENINLAFTMMFLALAVVMSLRFFRTVKRIKIKDEQPRIVRIMIIVMAFMIILASLLNVANNTWMDYVRTFLTAYVIGLFYIFHDGIGDEGVSINGVFYTWKEIRSWDYTIADKGTTIYIGIEKETRKGVEFDTRTINFNPKDSKAAIDEMKKNIAKKYTRMKKNG
ncbi:MAG: hypothetical protein IJ875_00190 [Solobacterium sp.]|nr:hypothetical protein [Solobacterium sp.]